MDLERGTECDGERGGGGTLPAQVGADPSSSRWHGPFVARSFYKGERLGSTPACAICVGAGDGTRAELHLPCGVRVWLCAAHRSVEFQTRRAGRDLVASLMHVWTAAGCLTRRRSRALDLHRARLLGREGSRPLPGSYSWPALRARAEAAFAAGERPGAVIARILERARCGDGVLPSVRTMRRWFREGRWLDDAPVAGKDGTPEENGPAGGDGELAGSGSSPNVAPASERSMRPDMGAGGGIPSEA